MKTAEGQWNSSGLLKVTVLQEDGTRSSLKDDRGPWNGMVTMSCRPIFFFENVKCDRHRISLRKGMELFCQDDSGLCLASVGLCCHLVATSGNDISVQVGRRSV